jgi:ribosomal protein L7Ae-like RNA K-turn-binding protein
MSDESRVLSLLSLSTKAGCLRTGETAAEQLLQKGQAELLIIASDASGNTKKKFINKCFYYKKPVLVYGESAVLSKSTGKQNRMVFVVTEPHFAERLQKLIESIKKLAENNMEVAECQKSAYMN